MVTPHGSVQTAEMGENLMRAARELRGAMRGEKMVNFEF